MNAVREKTIAGLNLLNAIIFRSIFRMPEIVSDVSCKEQVDGFRLYATAIFGNIVV